MSTKIEWARNADGSAGETWNPIVGTKGRWHCSKVSAGCKFCYAERLNVSNRFGQGPPYLAGADTLRLDQKALIKPLSWRKARTCFVCSMTDVWHEEAPFEWVERILDICRRVPQSVFLLLTKRAKRALVFDRWLLDRADPDWPENVGVGISVESQRRLIERMAPLESMRVGLRFVSFEPLLSPVDLAAWCDRCSVLCDHESTPERHKRVKPWLNWVIAGGESGRKDQMVRITDIRDLRALRDQCLEFAIPFFFKQWGEWSFNRPSRGFTGIRAYSERNGRRLRVWRVGRQAAGSDLDGRDWMEFPFAVEGQDAGSFQRRAGAGAAGGRHRQVASPFAAEELLLPVLSGGGADRQFDLF